MDQAGCQSMFHFASCSTLSGTAARLVSLPWTRARLRGMVEPMLGSVVEVVGGVVVVVGFLAVLTIAIVGYREYRRSDHGGH
jgi:hypothetical protein